MNGHILFQIFPQAEIFSPINSKAFSAEFDYKICLGVTQLRLLKYLPINSSPVFSMEL